MSTDSAVTTAETRPKRRRVVSKKVSHDFCGNCRTRRTKCDATRPECLKCVRAGLQCPGYTIWDVAVRPSTSKQPEELASASTALIPSPRPVQRNPEALPDWSRSAIDYLLSVGVHAHARIVPDPSTLYCVLDYVVHHSNTNAAWLRMLAALGSAWQARVNIVQPTRWQMLDMTKYDTALQIHADAVAASTSLMRDPSEASMQCLLVTLYLHLCVEGAFSDVVAGFRRLRYMDRVLQRYRDTPGEFVATGEIVHMIMKVIDSVFADVSMNLRLDVSQSGHINDLDRTSALTRHHSGLQRRLTFNSFDDARLHLEELVESLQQIELDQARSSQIHVQSLLRRHARLLQSLGATKLQCLQQCVSRTMPPDTSILQRTEDKLRQLQAWQSAFDAFSQTQPPRTASMLFLELRSCYSYICAALSRGAKEMACDQHTKDFVRMITLAEDYMNQRETGPRPTRDMRRSRPYPQRNPFEWGLLKALYLVCAKCRDPMSRRRACKLLLEAQRRENDIDSDALAGYALAVIAVEECAAGSVLNEAFVLPGLFSDSIPEGARVAEAVASDLESNDGRFELVCGRYSGEGTDWVELVSYVCTPELDSAEPSMTLENETIMKLPIYLDAGEDETA